MLYIYMCVCVMCVCVCVCTTSIQMLLCVVSDFMTRDLSSTCLKCKFAFESQISSWAQKNALHISETLSRGWSSLSFLLFREVCVCVCVCVCVLRV